VTSRTPKGDGLDVVDPRWILDHLSGGVVVVNASYDVCYRNEAARRLMHPHRLRLHAPLPDIATEPSLASVAERLFRRGVLGELELHAADGRAYVVHGVLHAPTRTGLLQFDDVSARARQSRAEHDFAVNAAHEFLSPLTAIAGAAQVLHDSAKDIPHVRDRFIGHILDGANRLISISRALLVLARAEANIEPPRVAVVPLRPLLQQVVDDAIRSRREVAVECSADAAVLADENLLHQAVANLLQNADRHARDAIRVAVRDREDTFVIEVSDDGVGMMPEHLERATERFFSGERDAGGFGIGLSVARRAIEILGGSLSLVSDDSGTRARIELPRARLVET
jgi:signal transduction histidine kinase